MCVCIGVIACVSTDKAGGVTPIDSIVTAASAHGQPVY